MTYGAKFTHGTRTFDLNSAEFDLYQDFSFPAADEALNIGSGTSGNRSGGKVVSKRPQDRWWAWSVRVLGTSKAQTHMAARRLSAWLSQALEDTSDKVYFEYRVNADIPEPIFGQHGAAYRWEVKAAIVDMDGSYYVAGIPENAIILPISLLVAPYALGKKQLLAQTKGGILEDTIGTQDGFSRGVIVPETMTNKLLNPIFGHGTWLNGWTAGAECTVTQNTNGEYVLFGRNSAYCVPTGTSTNYILQAINVGNTNQHTISFYVKLPDGGAVTASHAVITYNDSPASTYTNLGNGFWRITVTATGVAAPTNVFLTIVAPIYVCGAQMEQATYSTPLASGDMLGCAWSGTAHESTSVRAAAYLRLPVANIINLGLFTVTMTVKWRHSNAHPNDIVLFSNANIQVKFEADDDKIYLTDGTNSAVSSALTFSEGDIYVMHFVVSVAAGLKVYINGAANGANATYTPPAQNAYFWVGSDISTQSQGNFTILDLASWDTELTAAQIAADYGDISDHARGGDGKGQRLSAIPWMWTKDGDNQVDNCTDSTRNHYAIAGGIPGTTEAETEIQGTLSGDYRTVNMSNFASKNYVNPAAADTLFFADISGTALAGSVGGEVKVTSIDTSGAIITNTYPKFTIGKIPELAGKNVAVFTRIIDTAGDYIQLTSNTYIGGASMTYSDTGRPMATSSGNARLYRSVPTGMPIVFNWDDYPTTEAAILLSAKRAGTTNDLKCDYAVAFPRPFLSIKSNPNVFPYDMGAFTLRGNEYITGSSTVVGYFNHIIGDAIEFVPNRYNLLQSLMGDEAADPVIGDTLTYVIHVTPRYLLV